jgi:hypothetical protein
MDVDGEKESTGSSETARGDGPGEDAKKPEEERTRRATESPRDFVQRRMKELEADEDETSS